jgi:hypothetical protein
MPSRRARSGRDFGGNQAGADFVQPNIRAKIDEVISWASAIQYPDPPRRSRPALQAVPLRPETVRLSPVNRAEYSRENRFHGGRADAHAVDSGLSLRPLSQPSPQTVCYACYVCVRSKSHRLPKKKSLPCWTPVRQRASSTWRNMIWSSAFSGWGTSRCFAGYAETSNRVARPARSTLGAS